MPIIDITVAEGMPGPRLKTARGIYDFAVDGGAISTIALMGATLIPLGATILNGYIDVVTTVTSGGAATFGIQVESAGDIVAAGTGFASLAGPGRRNVLPGMTPGSATANTAMVRTTALRDISLVIAAATFTAGKFSVVLFYQDPLA